jgi:hypothetical protein
MKIYYINDENCKLSSEEQDVLNELKSKFELKKISIKSCKKSRYLCNKQRINDLRKALERRKEATMIVFFNFMHLGRSFNEILKLLLDNKEHSFTYAYPANKVLDFSHDFECNKESNYVMCKVDHLALEESSNLSEKIIKQQGILYGLQCTKKKLKGRTKGAVNKTSDYAPYHDKIAEMLSKGSSLITIIRLIGVGSKSGLSSYIKKNISNNQPQNVKIIKPKRKSS